MSYMGDDLIGKTLGTCVLQKLIGRGGMGAVYLAQQTRPYRHVAVKVLLSDLIDEQKYSEFLARFRREADIVAQLQQVNIIPIYEYGEQDGIPYLVMPYFPGGSLQQVLARQSLLQLTTVVSYISQAAMALDYAHAHHVIHRDLKPGNFLLADDGRLVLTDFGIARMLQGNAETSMQTVTRGDTILGTPEYMAPEMFTDGIVDYRADIYALGIILYQLLSGSVPFKGDTVYALVRKHVEDEPPSLHALRPDLPPEIDTIIQTALAKSPEDRFQSAGALAQSLRHMFSSYSEKDGNTVSSRIIFNAHENISEQRNEQNIKTIQVSNTPVNIPRHTKRAVQPLLFVVGILLVLLLVVGGVLIGLQLSREHIQTSKSQPTITSTTTVGRTPQTTPTLQTPPIPEGALLYSASSPGAVSSTGNACDNGGEQWVNYNTPVITCQQSGTQIANPHSNAPDLVGTFLKTLPSGQFATSNYVIEATIQQAQTSSADFGIYFRNQPDNHQGVYTFLVHPDGTWGAYVYNDTTAVRTEIGSGPLGVGDIHTSVKLDIVVNGATFTFYANGHEVGSVNNGIYTTGTVGIAVDAGGIISVRNFSLYQVA